MSVALWALLAIACLLSAGVGYFLAWLRRPIHVCLYLGEKHNKVWGLAASTRFEVKR